MNPPSVLVDLNDQSNQQIFDKAIALISRASPKAMAAMASNLASKIGGVFKPSVVQQSEDELRESLHFDSRPEVELTLGDIEEARVPTAYFEAARAHFHLPLTMFTNKNLLWAASNMAKIKMMKNNNYKLGEKSILYVNVDHKRFQGEEKMSYKAWFQACKDYLGFAKDSRTDSILHDWLDQHWSWVDQNHQNRRADWPMLLAYDITTRERYRTRPFRFKSSDAEVNLIVFIQKTQMQMATSSSYQADSPPSGSRSSWSLGCWTKNFRPNREESRSTSLNQQKGGSRSRFSVPFRQGQTGGPSSSVCLICARVGHTIRDCTQHRLPDGKEVICTVIGNSFVIIASNKFICAYFNTS